MIGDVKIMYMKISGQVTSNKKKNGVNIIAKISINVYNYPQKMRKSDYVNDQCRENYRRENQLRYS